MGTSALKSTSITNLDTTPPIQNSAGKGAAGYIKSVGGYVTAVAADAALSTYRLVRLPSNAVVKFLQFESEAQGAGKVQLGVYYSDAVGDGTPSTVDPTVAVSVKLFADDIDCASAVLPGDKTFYTGGGYTLDKRNQPLWQAAGLTADPGGFLDIVATVHTTAVTTGTGKLGVNALFV